MYSAISANALLDNFRDLKTVTYTDYLHKGHLKEKVIVVTKSPSPTIWNVCVSLSKRDMLL